jgi:chemotaxis protein CheD
MSDIVNVGLGEIKVSRNLEDVLVAYGLGSCLGIGMYDPDQKIAGLLHAVLPNHPNGRIDKNPRFVDSGIEALLTQLSEAGMNTNQLIIRMAGGANMLTAPGFQQSFNIGVRNVEIAYLTLKNLNLKITSQEVGGNIGRTVRFYVNGGRMTIRTVGNQEREI